MRIFFQRTGGFHPPAMRRSVTVDMEKLTPDEAQHLQALLDATKLREKPPEANPPQARPDMFTYHVTLEEGGQQHTIKASEAELTEPFRELVAWLMKRSTLEK